MIRVLANGCFDILHDGHIAHLREAKAMGDILIVALTIDEAVRREKGAGRPILPWGARADILRELRCVDMVVPSTSGPDAVAMLRPDIVVKGIDYIDHPSDWKMRIISDRVGTRMAFTGSAKKSTTDIIRKIKDEC